MVKGRLDGDYAVGMKGHVLGGVATLLRPLGRSILRRVYQHALKTEDPIKKGQLLSQSLRWRRYIYPPGGRVMEIAALNEGLRLWVNLCELEGGNLYFGVPFEPCELAIVKRLVKPGDVFFDVGANIGVYSLLASQLIGGLGAVHAFEPVSCVYELLLRNILLNQASNVTPNRLAVEETSGKVELFVNRESGLSSLGHTERGQVMSVERVESTTLDEYAEMHNISELDFLKVDVEGYEGHVLRGGKRLIERSSNLAILCELAEKNYRSLNLSINGVMDWIRERGYEVWEIDRSRQLLVKLEQNRPLYENQNFVFVRPGTVR